MIKWLQITAGRGPEECRWVVYQLAKKIAYEARKGGFDCEVIESIPGSRPETLSSALLAS